MTKDRFELRHYSYSLDYNRGLIAPRSHDVVDTFQLINYTGQTKAVQLDYINGVFSFVWRCCCCAVRSACSVLQCLVVVLLLKWTFYIFIFIPSATFDTTATADDYALSTSSHPFNDAASSDDNNWCRNCLNNMYAQEWPTTAAAAVNEQQTLL